MPSPRQLATGRPEAEAAPRASRRQGGWTYFSVAAARRLVAHVLARGAAAFGSAERWGRHALPRVKKGVCTMVTDVSIGWLGAQASAAYLP